MVYTCHDKYGALRAEPRYEWWDMTILFEGTSVTSWEGHRFFTSEVMTDGWPQTVNHLHSVQTQCSTTSTAGEDIIHTKVGVFFNWQCISANLTGGKRCFWFHMILLTLYFLYEYILFQYISTTMTRPLHNQTLLVLLHFHKYSCEKHISPVAPLKVAFRCECEVVCLCQLCDTLVGAGSSPLETQHKINITETVTDEWYSCR